MSVNQGLVDAATGASNSMRALQERIKAIEKHLSIIDDTIEALLGRLKGGTKP